MALKKEAQIKALKALRYSDEDIATMVDGADEVDIDLPTLHIYDPTGLAELETNLRRGWIKDTAAAEIWCRNMNTEHELGLTGAAAKDQKKVQDALKAKWIKEAGATPAEWEAKFTTLQTTVDTEKAEKLTIKQQLDQLQAEKKYRKMFFAEMSDALDEDEWVARLQKNFDIRTEGDIEGLFDKANNKFVMDDKANVLPFAQAWEKTRAEERFKSWHKAKAEPAIKSTATKTHDPAAARNPATAPKKKYNSDEEIRKEVDKQYPPDKRKDIPRYLAVRQELFNRLRAQKA